MLPLIIDHRPPYLRPEAAGASLLTLPVGARSLLDSLARLTADLPGRMSRELFVVPSFPYDQCYERRIRSATSDIVRVFPPGELDTVLEECEPADYVLVLDSARWPVGGLDLAAALNGHGDYRAATHLIAVGTDAEGTREHVERDGCGRVRRVQRLYDGVIWPEVATTRVFLSLAPASALDGVRFTSLGGLRSALCAKGVFSRDVPVALNVADLTEAEGVLTLNEAHMGEEFGRTPPPGFVRENSWTLLGRECRVATSARLIGPVILHGGVAVEAGVTIVGPTVVGSGARLQRDAMIAQSTLAPDTVVASGTTIRQRVASGHYSGDASPVEAVPTSSHTAVGSVRARARVMTMSIQGSFRARLIHAAAKRIIDVVFASAALLALSPLLIAVAILIKLGSPGPVLFVHRREQKGGREFPCLKFRTMVADAHRQQRALYKQNEVDGPQFNVPNDPRVTPLGWWLRGTNIDELPQLINVLLGHMSLVGPRPSPFRENQICVPWRQARLSVRPGITGLWQLCRSPDRSAGDFHQWIFYDMAYVRHFSIWLDVKILLATVLTRGGRSRVPLSWMIREKTGSAEHPQPMLAA